MEPLQGERSGPSNLDQANTFTHDQTNVGRDTISTDRYGDRGNKSLQPGRDPRTNPSEKFRQDFLEAKEEVEAKIEAREPSKYQKKQEAKLAAAITEVEEPVKETVATEIKSEKPVTETVEETTAEPVVETKKKINGFDVDTPPDFLTKADKEKFKDWPVEARLAIVKKGVDAERGVAGIKQKYQDIDEAMADIDPDLKRLGISRKEHITNSNFYTKAIKGAVPGVTPAQTGVFLAYQNGATAQEIIEAANYIQQAMPKQQSQQNGHVNLSPQDREALNAAYRIKEHSDAEAQRQNAARLEDFKKDHPHFDKVNIAMGRLLSPNKFDGQSAVPWKNGMPDMKEAYRIACLADPEVQAEIEQEKLIKEAEARKQKTEAQKNAGKSLPSKGSPNGADTRNVVPQRGMTVRESLKAAIEQHKT